MSHALDKADPPLLQLEDEEDLIGDFVKDQSVAPLLNGFASTTIIGNPSHYSEAAVPVTEVALVIC
ncbi:GL22155 [Drosophila persimilis]|uniref:GL22155 n=1 Tax=Drosophila persimilis TaxID=7234 RepID=B4GF75_DROPE|nr:GL22155 [Drosophila persimilis]